MKRIIIIGGTSGIGAALAKILEEEGHNVTTMSRSERTGHDHSNSDEHKHKVAPEKEVVSEHKIEFEESTEEAPSEKGFGKRLHLANLDVTNVQPNFLAFNQPLDGLVYCPGTINLKPFNTLKVTDFQHDLEVNFLGLVKTLQTYYPLLKLSEQASVVLFSTVAVQTGMSFHTSVAAAKGAVEGLSRALAAEWAPKVRVNTIAPSLTETPLAQRLLRNEKQVNASIDRHPMKRIGQAEDIAQMAAFLLSDKASWITGQVIQVDGGLSAIKNL